MTLTPGPVRRKDVTQFTNYCVPLRALWLHHQSIFEGSALKRELLQHIAPTFFADLNSILIEHLILQICKLTDPATTKRGKDVLGNLTVHYLLEFSDFSKAPADLAQLQKIVKRIDAFRARIVPARNKRIGHLDLASAHVRRSLGRAPVSAWLQFWCDLQDFLTIMHRRYVTKRVPFYLNAIGGFSDADQLVKALQEATYFHSMLDNKAVSGVISRMAVSKYSDV